MKVNTTYGRCEVTAKSFDGRWITCVLLKKTPPFRQTSIFEDVDDPGALYMLEIEMRHGEECGTFVRTI